MASDDDPTVPIVCDGCDTRTDVPLSEAADTIARHNEQLHDGEDVAEVDPEIKRHLTDMVAEDLELVDEG